MTKEEMDAFVDTRCEQIRDLVGGCSDEDFDNEVDDLTYEWARHHMPVTDRDRHQNAGYKRKVILRQRQLFEKLRLFKPLAMKYPSVMAHFVKSGVHDIENRKFDLNGDFIYREEATAGFTYEDFVKATSGGTFDGWGEPSIGDTVKGKVASFSRDGAFIEIGAKSWAYMALKDISLAPIATPGEALTIGEEVEAVVIDVGADSLVPGDFEGQQLVVSRSVIQREAAWEQVLKAFSPDGTPEERTLSVNVKSLNAIGAIVQAKSGLEGFIRNEALAGKAGDPRIVGTDLTVEIDSINAEAFNNPDRKPGQYYIYFSYANAATKELARKVNEFDIVEGPVTEIMDAQLLLDIQGYPCRLSKMSITSVKQEFSLSDLFKVGEVLKCAVVRADRSSGEVTLSTRALEPRKGMMLTERAVCFEKAEETIVKFKAESEKQKGTVEARVLRAVADKSEETTKPKSVSTFDVMGDDEDDMAF